MKSILWIFGVVIISMVVYVYSFPNSIGHQPVQSELLSTDTLLNHDVSIDPDATKSMSASKKSKIKLGEPEIELYSINSDKKRQLIKFTEKESVVFKKEYEEKKYNVQDSLLLKSGSTYRIRKQLFNNGKVEIFQHEDVLLFKRGEYGLDTVFFSTGEQVLAVSNNGYFLVTIKSNRESETPYLVNIYDLINDRKLKYQIEPIGWEDSFGEIIVTNHGRLINHTFNGENGHLVVKYYDPAESQLHPTILYENSLQSDYNFLSFDEFKQILNLTFTTESQNAVKTNFIQMSFPDGKIIRSKSFDTEFIPTPTLNRSGRILSTDNTSLHFLYQKKSKLNGIMRLYCFDYDRFELDAITDTAKYSNLIYAKLQNISVVVPRSSNLLYYKGENEWFKKEVFYLDSIPFRINDIVPSIKNPTVAYTISTENVVTSFNIFDFIKDQRMNTIGKIIGRQKGARFVFADNRMYINLNNITSYEIR